MTVKSTLLLAIPLFCLTSCFMGDNSPTTDDANDAAGTGDANLAKEVVGVGMLSPDDRYEEANHYLTEEFIHSNFKLEEAVELKETVMTEGVQYAWDGNQVGFTFGNYRPFPTIYAAENAFNKRYQPELVASMDAMPKKPYLNGGPASQGLANEWPVLAKTIGTKKDTVAANDSATTVSGVTAAATRTTPPAKSTGKEIAVMGVGDKAVWEPAASTLHVLYNNHILNVQVKTKDAQAAQQQRAAMIANVILGEIAE